jgi:recombination protein RecA
MGVNIDELESIKAYSGDENLNALEMLIKTGEFGVAVVDSVSALIPKEEAEADMEDKFMGLLARLMGKACRKFAQLCSETNTLLIFINQVRYKIGAYGDPTTTTGGEALNFYATGRIKVSGGESKSSRIVSVTGDVVGHKTAFEIKKNKLAPPFRSAEIPLIYGVGYDSHWEVLSISQGLGIIDRSGAWFKYEDKNIGNGEINTISFLKDNPEIYNKIRDQIIDQTGLKALYEQNGR